MTDSTDDVDWYTPRDVTCARCGKDGTDADFIAKEGDEWECPECWCEALERCLHPKEKT